MEVADLNLMIEARITKLKKKAEAEKRAMQNLQSQKR